MRISTLLTCWALVALETTAALAEGYAIVVGVNACPDFRLPDGSRPRPLLGAEADAVEVARVLVREYGFPEGNVRLLAGSQATRQALKSAFSQASARIDGDDVFVFHFSGHGTQVPDRRPFDEADGRDEALCLADTMAHAESAVSDDELGLWLDAIKAGYVTVILDCCHAGTGTKGLDPDLAPRYLPMGPAGRPLTVPENTWRELRGQVKGLGKRMACFFACQPEQQAYERRWLERRPPVRAGQFSHYLLEGLRLAAADTDHDGVVSNKELLDYTTQRLDETFNHARAAPADRQQPALETDTPDAAVFGMRRVLPP